MAAVLAVVSVGCGDTSSEGAAAPTGNGAGGEDGFTGDAGFDGTPATRLG